ncbi:TetR/AcrR family transcriptional regulator [Larkinella bovis]|uniref:TetR/AcrR family transcriptional regulator n=1 Tax=Larkinella bovis TaxID=683041 RepID=A0ABW0IKI1_9BACT
MAKNINEIGTEERIKEAAKEVFLEKGFDGATMKDIAVVAGMNSALTHYYFRSKEKLFWVVFEDLLKEWLKVIRYTLDKPVGLKEKIVELIEKQFEFHQQNPGIILFLMNEAERDPESMVQKMCISPALHESCFFQQVEEAVQQKEIRAVNPFFLLSMVFSFIKQLFAAKALYTHVFGLTEVEFVAYTQESKRDFMDMVLTYLYKKDC